MNSSVFGQTNHTDITKHTSGSSFDPVIGDLPDSVVICSPLCIVGLLHHMVLLKLIQKDALLTNTKWL